MAANLPPDGAVAAQAAGGERQWAIDTHLLAIVADLLNFGNFQRSGKKGGAPKPLTRPRMGEDFSTVRSSRAFNSAEEFDEWRASRLKQKG